MNRGVLVVVSGPSGVGKGTVLHQMLAQHDHFFYSVSATTREPREGEVNGRDYFFISEQAFKQKIKAGDMLEYAVYSGCCYGTPRDVVEEKLNAGLDVILEIEVQGAMQVKRVMPEALTVFISPPSFDELRRRLEGRGTEAPEKVERRLKIAREEMAKRKEYDAVIVNFTPEQAAKELYGLIEQQKSTRESP